MPNCLHEISSHTAPSAQPLEKSQRDELQQLLTKVISDPSLIKILQEAITQKANHEQCKIVRMDELSKRLGLAKSTIYQAIAAGRFPRGFSINGGKAMGWLSTSVDQWLEHRAASQTGGV